MNTQPQDTLTIHVRTLAELFSAPARDPWRDGPEFIVSGIEQALAQFRERRAPHISKLIIEVSSRSNTPDADDALAARAPEAWQNYCLSRAAESGANEKLQRSTAWRSLLRLAPTIAVVLALSAFFEHVQPLPAIINRLFSEGFIVLGWVMLWRPLEGLFFDASQPGLLRFAFEKLARLRVTVVMPKR